MRPLVTALVAAALLVAPVSSPARETPTLLEKPPALEADHAGLCAPLRGPTALPTALDEPEQAPRLGPHGTDRPEALVQALNDVVFGRFGIRASQDLRDPCNLFLSSVLARKQGCCVGIAALYLVLAERLGLPNFVMATPSHVFVRYDDGTTRINLETFPGGAPVPDQQYITEQRIAPRSIRKEIFLRNLTADEFLAQARNNLGVIYSERQDLPSRGDGVQGSAAPVPAASSRLVQHAPLSAIHALARLGVARAHALAGDTARSRAAYAAFLALWKDADPDLPILQAARAEYARLK